MEIFDEIIKYVGSQSKLAKLLRISPMAVSQWRKKIPLSRAIEIETILNGKFTREQMRPEYYRPAIKPACADVDPNTLTTTTRKH